MSSAEEMSNSRLAAMRLMPFSYFCTCWKVTPKYFGQALLAHADFEPARAHALPKLSVHGVRGALVIHGYRPAARS